VTIRKKMPASKQWAIRTLCLLFLKKCKLLFTSYERCQNLTLVLPQAEQKGVNLAYQAQAQALVLADHNMIRLVVRNLLSNAIKYCKQGETIRLSYQTDNAQVTVSIQDTGIGMNVEQLKTVFTSHVASTYGTNNEKGAGLGLMLCKDFVERNAGKIWVESEAGKGSTFFFTLPIAQTENTDTEDSFWVERLESGGTLYRL
jgi:two-component system, sensor histidine kinase and response regulator